MALSSSRMCNCGGSRRWVEDEDLRAQAAEDALCDRAELELQGIAEQDLRNELLRRMKERALARGDFKLAAEAIKLDLKAERVALERERVAVQSRKSGGPRNARSQCVPNGPAA